MTSFDDAVSAVKNHSAAFQSVLRSWPAYLGDGEGNVIGSQVNYYHCRYPTPESPAIEVYANGCPPNDGQKVMVGNTADQPNLIQIVSWNDSTLDDTVNDHVKNHADQHFYLGGDTVWVDWRQITTFRVQPYAGLTVYVEGGVLPRSGADLQVLPQIVDLTSSVPGTSGQARYALLSLDTTGAIVVTNGSTVSPVFALDASDVPSTPSGNFRLAAVALQYGQTLVTESLLQRDILDLRWPQESMAGSGVITPAMLANASAQYKYLVSGATPFAYAESAGALNIASGKTLTVSNSITIAGSSDGFTFTVPETGTAAILARTGGQTFTTQQIISLSSAVLAELTVDHELANSGTYVRIGGVASYPNYFGSPFGTSGTHSGPQAWAGFGTLMRDNANQFTSHGGPIRFQTSGLGSSIKKNISYTSKSDADRQFLFTADADIWGTPPGTFIQVGANFYTVKAAASDRITVLESIAGEAATGTLVDVQYTPTRMNIDTTGNFTFGNPTKLSMTSAGVFTFGKLPAVTGITPTGFNIIAADAGYSAGINFQSTETGTNTVISQAAIESEGVAPWNSVANASSMLRFSTTSAGTLAERVRISAVGNVAIGTTTTTPRLNVLNTADIQALLVTGHTTQAVATSLAQITRNDTTAGVSSMLGLTALGSGADGDGGSVLMAGKSSTTASQNMGALKWLWASATHASRKAKIQITTYDTAERIGLAIEADGSAQDVYFEGGAGSGLPYGGCWGNEIGWSQASAAQDTWYIISDADMADSSGGLNLVTHDGSGKLTVTKAGRYYVVYTVSQTNDRNNKHIQTGIAINGTVQNDGINHVDGLAASIDTVLSGNAILALTASQYIEIAIRTTDTGTPTISVDHLNITIFQVGG